MADSSHRSKDRHRKDKSRDKSRRGKNTEVDKHRQRVINAQKTQEKAPKNPAAPSQWALLDKHFITVPKFKNALPNAPSGPFFKNTNGFVHNRTDLSSYHRSSLEKSYIWKPQLGKDLGTKFNFVDTAEWVGPKKGQGKPPLHPDEVKYLSWRGESTSRQVEQDRPSWLRSTLYVANDFTTKLATGPTPEEERRRAQREALSRKRSRPEDTFAECEATVTRLRREAEAAANSSSQSDLDPARATPTVVCVSRLVPDVSRWKDFSLLGRFDPQDDPYAATSGANPDTAAAAAGAARPLIGCVTASGADGLWHGSAMAPSDPPAQEPTATTPVLPGQAYRASRQYTFSLLGQGRQDADLFSVALALPGPKHVEAGAKAGAEETESTYCKVLF
jgi:hypothetical protein